LCSRPYFPIQQTSRSLSTKRNMLRAGSTPDTYIRRRSLSTSCPVQAFGKRKVRRRQHSRLGTACSFRPGPFTLIGTPAQPTDSVSWNLSWLKKTRDDLSVWIAPAKNRFRPFSPEKPSNIKPLPLSFRPFLADDTR